MQVLCMLGAGIPTRVVTCGLKVHLIPISEKLSVPSDFIHQFDQNKLHFYLISLNKIQKTFKSNKNVQTYRVKRLHVKARSRSNFLRLGFSLRNADIGHRVADFNYIETYS